MAANAPTSGHAKPSPCEQHVGAQQHHLLRGAVEALQVVIATLLGGEHVHNRIPKVQHFPFAPAAYEDTSPLPSFAIVIYQETVCMDELM
jgi:hypothetical protein